MYAVRSKSGRVLCRCATRGEAERFVRGRTARSPYRQLGERDNYAPPYESEIDAGSVEDAKTLWHVLQVNGHQSIRVGPRVYAYVSKETLQHLLLRIRQEHPSIMSLAHRFKRFFSGERSPQ
jgi:hypothetical protein